MGGGTDILLLAASIIEKKLINNCMFFNSNIKCVLLILFVFQIITSNSQVYKKTTVTDTSHVAFNDFDDCFYIKNFRLNRDNWMIYYDSIYSKLANSLIFQGNTYESLQYHKNGFLKRRQVCSFEIIDSLIIHETLYDTWWYNNGQLKVNVDFSKFPCLVKNYYKNGKQRFEMTWINNDEVEGEWKEWYDTGQLKSEGYYLKNEKHGTWTYYLENGDIDKIEEYLNGKLQKQK